MLNSVLHLFCVVLAAECSIYLNPFFPIRKIDRSNLNVESKSISI